MAQVNKFQKITLRSFRMATALLVRAHPSSPRATRACHCPLYALEGARADDDSCCLSGLGLLPSSDGLKVMRRAAPQYAVRRARRGAMCAGTQKVGRGARGSPGSRPDAAGRSRTRA